jgi:hypothetical protein
VRGKFQNNKKHFLYSVCSKPLASMFSLYATHLTSALSPQSGAREIS